MGSEHNGFPPPPILAPRPMINHSVAEPPPTRRRRSAMVKPLGSLKKHHLLPHGRKRWIGCCGGGLSCFGKQKGGKRIAPAARMREANQLPNGPQATATNNHQTTTIAATTGLVALSLLAPPSSPASFSTPSTAQSPNCYSSPGGLAPSSSGNMFAIGPYAHETQLVSPPVFSTFTTEPSTAPLTPPPEMSHLTTPSSPDVPYAHFLSSSISAGDRSSWDPSSVPPTQYFKSSHQDSNFFCPDTFAQFYIDHSSLPHSGGRISVSKESDAAYSDTRNQSKQSTTWYKQQETEEMGEAYRASFGFSADEIVTTTTSKYVEISDASVLDKVDDDDEDDDTSLFTIKPFASGEQPQEHMMNLPTDKAKNGQKNMSTPQYLRASSYRAQGPNSNIPDNGPQKHSRDNSGQNFHVVSDDEDAFSSKMGNSRYGRKYPPGSSSSDAEIDYRRGRRSLREGKGYF